MGVITETYRYYIRCCFILVIMVTGNLQVQSQAPVPSRPELRVIRNYPDTLALKQMIYRADTLSLTDSVLKRALFTTVLERSRALMSPRGIFLALTRLAYLEQLKGNHQGALLFHKQAMQYAAFPQIRPHLNILFNNVGLSYSQLGNYEQALHYYYKALAALGESGGGYNGTDSVGIYTNIGVLWSRLGEQTYAFQTFEQVRQIADRNKDTMQLGMVYANMGEIYFKKGDYDRAGAYYKKGLVLVRQTRYYQCEVSTLTGLANLARHQQHYNEAIGYLKEALDIVKRRPISADNRIGALTALGAVYLDTKQYAKAKTILTEAYAEANEISHKELLEEVIPLIASVNAVTGSYRDAYRQQVSYSVMKDSLYMQEKSRSLDVLVSSRTAAKDRAMLAQQLQITRQKNQLQRLHFMVGGVIAGAICLLIIGIVLTRNHKQKQAIQDAVILQLQQGREIDRLKAQVHGEEQERQRIARELHDGIASQLWAIKLNVDSMQQEVPGSPIAHKLGTIFQQLTDTVLDVRKTAHNLMPDLLLEEGLATAIASLCEKTGMQTQLEVDYQEYGIVPKVDKEIELSLYRMVQELVQNVLKHATNATHLLVQLSSVHSLLSITVEDNGEGFRHQTDGVGIQQIRKRAMAMKGHFDLQSIPGKGTTAYLEFDLQYFL